MFNVLKSKEQKRIEFFFNLYESLVARGESEESARVSLIEEIKIGKGLLKEQFMGLDFETKLEHINKLFAPLRIIDYDLIKLVGFLVAWEYPDKYNYVPAVEQIRSNKHPQTYLENKVIEIGRKFHVGDKADT